jgi:AcrR family transcriptional regulator
MSNIRSVDTSRGALARERMLLAALDLFGRHGFDATTTRMISEAASMNLGAIPYYFGSKEDLYARAAGHLAGYIEQQQRGALSLLKAHAAASDNPAQLIDLVVNFMLDQARMLFAEGVPASWVQFFLRAQAEHGQAFEQIFAQSVEPVQACLSEIVARIIGRPVDDFQTRALTFIAFYQFVCLRLADGVLMRRLQWDAITPQRLEQLLSIMGPGLRAQLVSAAQLTEKP